MKASKLQQSHPRQALRVLLALMVAVALQGCMSGLLDPAVVEDEGGFGEDPSENPKVVDEKTLDQALTRMIGDLERSLEEAEMEAAEEVLEEDGTYRVRTGDYLDGIIKKTVGDSPLRRDILRDAFVRANPQAFKRSNPNWLLANKRLRVPDVEDLKKVIFTDESRRKKPGDDQPDYAEWIQYP